MKKYFAQRDLNSLGYFAYVLQRGIVAISSYPVRWLGETSRIKHAVRMCVLTIQNSLPTELAVNKGDTVVQVGTPWPQTMRRFRKAVGNDGALFIIEAMPENQERLEAAIKESGFENVRVLKGAAWSERKSGSFLISPHRGDHRIRAEGIEMDNDHREINAEMEEIEIEFYTIDELLEDAGVKKVDFLSITINGAEHDALVGARKTLTQNANIRVFSKGHAMLENGLPISSIVMDYLKSLGFQVKHTRGELSTAMGKNWKRRSGDVYAWRNRH